jgi:hypothetical protein
MPLSESRSGIRLGINLFYALVLIVLSSPTARAADSWACTEGVATLRKGDAILACGIGLGSTEPEARLKALDYAKAEFDRVCSMSSDCRGREVTLIPGRNACETLAEGQVRCYRGMTFEWVKGPATGDGTSEAEMALLNERIRLREQELEAAREAFEKRQRLKELDRKIAAMNRDDESEAGRLERETLAPHSQWFTVGGEFGVMGLPWDLPQVETPVVVSFFLEFRPTRWLGFRGGVGGFNNGYEVSEYYYDYGANVSGSVLTIGVPLYYNLSGAEDTAHFFVLPEYGSMDWEFQYNTGEYAGSSYYSPYELQTLTGSQDFTALSIGFESRPKTGLGYSFRVGVQKYEDYYDLKGETQATLGFSFFVSF